MSANDIGARQHAGATRPLAIKAGYKCAADTSQHNADRSLTAGRHPYKYYGSTLASTRFNDVVAEQGEAMLGIVDLFDAVTDRLDMVSFTLTTNYQQRMTALQFWLTVVFGATEIGFIAASIATWYYRTGLGVVLAWTLGASVVSGAILVALLRNKIK